MLLCMALVSCVVFLCPVFTYCFVKIHAGESLLRLVSEMKQSIIVYNSKNISESVAADQTRYKAETQRRKEATQGLRVKINSALEELEAYYYAHQDPLSS